MYMQQSVVQCESGLHNKQATFFIQKANEFQSSIWMEVEERRIKGTRVLIIAEGSDEQEAVKVLSEMLAKDNI